MIINVHIFIHVGVLWNHRCRTIQNFISGHCSKCRSIQHIEFILSSRCSKLQTWMIAIHVYPNQTGTTTAPMPASGVVTPPLNDSTHQDNLVYFFIGGPVWLRVVSYQLRILSSFISIYLRTYLHLSSYLSSFIFVLIFTYIICLSSFIFVLIFNNHRLYYLRNRYQPWVGGFFYSLTH